MRLLGLLILFVALAAAVPIPGQNDPSASGDGSKNGEFDLSKINPDEMEKIGKDMQNMAQELRKQRMGAAGAGSRSMGAPEPAGGFGTGFGNPQEMMIKMMSMFQNIATFMAANGMSSMSNMASMMSMGGMGG